MKKLILLFLFTASAVAEDIWLAPSAAGSGNGSSLANAAAGQAFFNNASNWDTDVAADGKIGPGDTIRLTGVHNITAIWEWIGSGTVGNPITFKFETGAQMRHASGFSNGFIHPFNVSNIVIQGGNSLPVKTPYNGATDFRAPAPYQEDMVITSTGTGLPIVPNCRFIHGEGLGSNITIKNLWMYGNYIRTYQHPTDDAGGEDAPGAGISLRTNGNNVVIENCAVIHGETGLNISATSTGVQTGFRVSDCLVTDNSNGIKTGVGPSNLVGAQIVRNRIDHGARWGGMATAGFHSDGIQTIATTPGGRSDGIHVAYNHIGPYMGQAGDLTAFIFLEDFVNGSKVYNNLLEKGRGHSSNAVITAGTHGSFSGQAFEQRTVIAFNTIVHSTDDPRQSEAIATGTSLVVGNVVQHLRRWLLFDTNDSFAGGPTNNWSDYNVWYDHDPTESPFSLRSPTVGAPGGHSIPLWMSATPYDENSLIGQDPLLVDTISPMDMHLQSGSPARNLVPTTVDGFNFLTMFTVSGTPDDFYGTPRGTGNWDAGAIEFTAGGPTPPTVVSSAINTAGNQFSITLSENAAIGAGGAGGMSVAASGGPVTLETTPAISGATITWDITNRLIGQVESVTRTYAQPGNGIESQDDGADLASFSPLPVTNGSMAPQAATPTFAPPAGGYSGTQNVVISTTTSGATIRYTTNGTDPTGSSTLYTGPIAVSTNTTLKAKAFASGFLESPIATAVYQIGDFVVGNTWFNVPVASQTGTFTWSFRASPSIAPTDAVLGLGDHTAGAYADLAVIARFNSTGMIDAFNGTTGNYTALNAFPYSAGQAYDFVVTINVPAHTYSVSVAPASGGSQTPILSNAAFRSQSAGVTDLDNFGGLSTTGSITVSNMSFTTSTASAVIETLNVTNLRIVP